MNAIGGLDIGTTGSKISLYDEKARLLVSYYTEYVASVNDGAHTVHFGVIFDAVKKLLREATEKYDITALGVTSFVRPLLCLIRTIIFLHLLFSIQTQEAAMNAIPCATCWEEIT